MTTATYLTEEVCYGGEWMPRSQMIADLRRVAEDSGCPNPQAMVDRYLQGHDRFMQKLDESDCFIKARKRGEKRFMFIGDGYLTRLRVHASRWHESDVQESIAKMTADNPDYEFKVQRV